MKLKSIARKILSVLHIDATKNMQYDRLTRQLIKKALQKNSNCIDVGSHKGEILEMFLNYAPLGKHFAYEPVPVLFDNLTKKFGQKANISAFAIADRVYEANFKYVKNAPAYSGLLPRKYEVKNPIIEDIPVLVSTLDEMINDNLHIDLVKIDVEGAEFHVLKGGKQLLKKWKPIIIFECGLGASDYYKTDPEELFAFITEDLELKLYTLPAYENGKSVLDRAAFIKTYEETTEYYFVAAR